MEYSTGLTSKLFWLQESSNFWKNKNRIEKFKEITRQLLLNDDEAHMKALEDDEANNRA